MVAMGRALMAQPRLLLLDEPSLGLAPLVADEIFDIIHQLSRTGVTILLVEQNAARALTASPTAYLLANGRIVTSGKSQTLWWTRTCAGPFWARPRQQSGSLPSGRRRVYQYQTGKT
jgi:ABC-type branched-subunit amino acid transport system ATPase component